jgi:hypothetical protein
MTRTVILGDLLSGRTSETGGFVTPASEDSLAERRIAVSYEIVRRWVNHFGPMIAARICASADRNRTRFAS